MFNLISFLAIVFNVIVLLWFTYNYRKSEALTMELYNMLEKRVFSLEDRKVDYGSHMRQQEARIIKLEVKVAKLKPKKKVKNDK